MRLVRNNLDHNPGEHHRGYKRRRACAKLRAPARWCSGLKKSKQLLLVKESVDQDPANRQTRSGPVEIRTFSQALCRFRPAPRRTSGPWIALPAQRLTAQ
jgi:hypothetical protein